MLLTCTMCRSNLLVVSDDVIKVEFGAFRRLFLECKTCAEHISCMLDVPKDFVIDKENLVPF